MHVNHNRMKTYFVERKVTQFPWNDWGPGGLSVIEKNENCHAYTQATQYFHAN